MSKISHDYDKLDIDILQLLRREPRAGVREYARRLGIARGTVQARLDKMLAKHVIDSYAPSVNPAALGFDLAADVHLKLKQQQLDAAVAHLEKIPFILYADSTAGAEDLTCRVVATDLQHLERITIAMMSVPGVERVRTDIILRSRIAPRLSPLLDYLRAAR
ncbi:Lrp/AsnC family transcriptional regulator [Corynebacterium urogenitale]